MPPLRIGVTAGLQYPDPTRSAFKNQTLLFIDQALCEWIAAGEGIALLIPPATGSELREVLGLFDGIVLGVGSDVAPGSYGADPLSERWPGDPQRDRYEREIVELALELDIPLFGICRGIQMLNVALGGTLIQDLPTERPGLLHRDPETYERNLHPIEVVAGSHLESLIAAGPQARINSVHHQAIDGLADMLVAEAHAPDGVIEAVRLSRGDRYASAVQWHPEWAHMDDVAHVDSTKIRADFMEACRLRRR